jgi:hypothetical protein
MTTELRDNVSLKPKKRSRFKSLRDIKAQGDIAGYVNYLDRKGIDVAIRPALIERFKYVRSMRMKARRERNGLREAWAKVLAPLRLEYNYIKIRLHQIDNHKKEKHISNVTKANHATYRAVYWEYFAVLKHVRDELVLKQRLSNYTPDKAMLVEMGEFTYNKLNVKGDFKYGTYWTDWVDDEAKDRLLTKQAELCYTRKPLVPFFRRGDSIKKDNLEQHNRVRQAWLDELNMLLTEQDRTPVEDQSPHLLWSIKKIRVAIDRLDGVPLTRKAPTRWRSMLHKSDYDPTEMLRGDTYVEDFDYD